MSSHDPISASNLPAEIQKLIRLVITRSRLWKRERISLTLELLSHFSDGLDAGRTADDLIKTFGDPQITARLVGRAKRRNRPIWWQMLRFSAASAMALILFYLSTVFFLFIGRPSLRTDYIALLNEGAAKVPNEQRAYPLYLQAWRNPFFKSKELDKYVNTMAKFSPLWPQAIQAARQHPELIDQLRAAAMRPTMGFLAKPTRECTPEELDAWNLKPSMSLPTGTPCKFAECIIPDTRTFRASAELLLADMDSAAAQADADRVIADYLALLGLARHGRDMPFLIHQIHGFMVLTAADTELARVNVRLPNLMAGHRVSLLHLMATSAPPFDLNLLWERLAVPDFLQQIYTDDGHGDGRITTPALHLIDLERYLKGPESGKSCLATTYTFLASRNMGWLMLPLAYARMPSRAELQAQFDMVYAAMEHDNALAPWQRPTQSQAPDIVRTLMQQITSQGKYNPYVLMIADLSRCYRHNDTSRAIHESLLTAIALDEYRDKTGHYPSVLAELVPQYLPDIPLDYSTGGELRYKLVNGKPLLYGLGWDGRDDGGVSTTKPGLSTLNVSPARDWVLYPPPQDR